jgi:hypothetical protein
MNARLHFKANDAFMADENAAASTRLPAKKTITEFAVTMPVCPTK